MPVSASACKPSSGNPRRTARPATWASDSSPVTYSDGRVCDICAIACSSRVDLPMPGSPPTSTTAPSTSPPPSTRSNSPMPVETRASSLLRTSFNAVIFGVSSLPAQPPRRAAGRRGDGGFEHDLGQGVPGPAFGALPLPLVVLGAAFPTDVSGLALGHAVLVTRISAQDRRVGSRGARPCYGISQRLGPRSTQGQAEK